MAANEKTTREMDGAELKGRATCPLCGQPITEGRVVVETVKTAYMKGSAFYYHHKACYDERQVGNG